MTTPAAVIRSRKSPIRSSDLFGLGERSRELDGRIRPVCEGEDAQRRAVDVDVPPERRAALARDCAHIVIDRQLQILAGGHDHLTVGSHELDVAARLAELGPDGKERAARPLEDSERMS